MTSALFPDIMHPGRSRVEVTNATGLLSLRPVHFKSVPHMRLSEGFLEGNSLFVAVEPTLGFFPRATEGGTLCTP